MTLLRYSARYAEIWWPTAGLRQLDLSAPKDGSMLEDERARHWRLIPSDLERLRHRRPRALYVREITAHNAEEHPEVAKPPPLVIGSATWKSSS